MCQSKAEGGKRCELSDALSNVRRKVRYANRDKLRSVVEREVRKAVESYLEANPELARAHMPESQPFQVKGGRKPIPPHLLDLLSPANARTPIKRERPIAEVTKKAYEAHQEWKSRLTDEESNTIAWYTRAGYEPINALLRRRGMPRLANEGALVHTPAQRQARAEELSRRAQEAKVHLASAFSKAPLCEEPLKVYRYFKVPAGVSPQEFIEKYFIPGEGFMDPAAMSTSVDPDFPVAHVLSRNGGKRNTRYIMLEILTRQGASLQPRETTHSGMVQSLEHERLLPFRTKMRIAAVAPRAKYGFAEERPDLLGWYRTFAHATRYIGPGNNIAIPTVQLVDEELIKHYRPDN